MARTCGTDMLFASRLFRFPGLRSSTSGSGTTTSGQLVPGEPRAAGAGPAQRDAAAQLDGTVSRGLASRATAGAMHRPRRVRAAHVGNCKLAEQLIWAFAGLVAGSPLGPGAMSPTVGK